MALAACSSGPRITRTQDVPKSAETPYQNILVIGLFSSFDARKRLEKEVVKELNRLGTDAVRSTSMMTTKTPIARETYLAMVDKIGADAVLITHLVDMASQTTMKDMRPQATYEIRPTYYYNVWDVNLTEYVEPPMIEVKRSLVLATQLYAESSHDPVWGIESRSDIVRQDDPGQNYMAYINEAAAMVKQMSRDGLIAR